ncbi:radical SAM protein [Tissierella sp. MB52-C2]|uniref:radical SAM/SPASM domain-containing protein n=1 Tax=Tissierella sp. MB52-C2 TaxID=3070999 RepID=UPI00280A4E0E|nr:radical SAM protein [Tissierella sp. MB52-C2]WMM26882.1 radical SAM protein [Tissierella sp. MB52-C2]
MDIKIINSEKDNINIFFFPNNLRFFQVNNYTKQIIESYLYGDTLEQIENKFNIDNKTLSELIAKIENFSKEELEPMKDISFFDNKLEKLVISLTDSCNLSCSYCYESMQENFITKDSLNKKDIDRIFHVITEKYDEIAIIQIFGGEPLLRYELVEYIGSTVNDLYNNNRLKIMPSIGIVTNATIINDKIIDIFKKYNIKFTISFDGNPKSHDECRKFKNGDCSSEFILNNMDLLRSNNLFPSGIETTYTNHHKDQDHKIINMIDFMEKEFKINRFHITPVILEENHPYYLKDVSDFIDSIDDMFSRKENKIFTSIVGRFIDTLIKKQQIDYLCGAGITDLSISPDGRIYPCFMLFGAEDYVMGNIYDDNIYENNIFKNVKNQFIEKIKDSIKDCKNCYIKNLCHGCLGVNYIKNNDAFEPDSYSCEMYRAMIDRILINMSKLTNKNKNSSKGDA